MLACSAVAAYQQRSEALRSFTVTHATVPAAQPFAALVQRHAPRSVSISAAADATRLKGFRFQRSATLSVILPCQPHHSLLAPLCQGL